MTSPLRARRLSFSSSPQPPATSAFPPPTSTAHELEESLAMGGNAAMKARELLTRLDMENGSTGTNGASTTPYHRSPSPAPPIPGVGGGGAGAGNGMTMHSRLSSLTSACPPVTLSPNPGAGAGEGETSAYNSPILGNGTNGKGGWKYDWSGGAADDKDEAADDGGKSTEGKMSPGGSNGLAAGVGRQLDRFLSLPTNLLAFFLSPILHHHPQALNRSVPPSASLLSASTSNTSPLLPRPMKSKDSEKKSAKPSLSISTSTPASPAAEKRWPLLFRLALVLYLLFSTVQFSLGLIGALSGQNTKGLSGNGVDWKKRLEETTGGIINLNNLKRGDDDVRDTNSWGTVKRFGSTSAKQNIISGLSHTYRLAKMHEKVHWDVPDEIEPNVFLATSTPPTTDVTACIYSNEAWIDILPNFIENWQGPVSLVFELGHSRHSVLERQNVLRRIEDLRQSNRLIKHFVDWHFVGTPLDVKERTLNKTRERLVFNPIASNFHLNIARFFAKTDIIFQVDDARVLPSRGLRQSLLGERVRDIVLDRGDAIVVPTFGFMREDKLLNPHEIRQKLDRPQSGYWDGIALEEFDDISKEFVRNTFETLPIQLESWPQRKAQLVNLVSTKSSSMDFPVALFDARWDLNHGPTNWYLWRKSAADSKLLESPELGGGSGIGLDGTLGGGDSVFKVTDYDLHYSPNLVFSKGGQPWCTERFDRLSAACVYQLYLSGAEMWVLPDEWSWTLEAIEEDENKKEDPAEKLKNSISSRLYGKFHQEACMHYGREFLSVRMWDSDKAQHLRSVCSKTLGSWGMGESS